MGQVPDLVAEKSAHAPRANVRPTEGTRAAGRGTLDAPSRPNACDKSTTPSPATLNVPVVRCNHPPRHL